MAKVIVENAEVTRVQRGGKGFSAQTQYRTRNGETVTQKYTVWSDEQVHVGDVLNIEGLLGVKIEEFTNDQGNLIRYAAIHVNQPVISRAQTGPEPTSALSIDMEAPF